MVKEEYLESIWNLLQIRSKETTNKILISETKRTCILCNNFTHKNSTRKIKVHRHIVYEIYYHPSTKTKEVFIKDGGEFTFG